MFRFDFPDVRTLGRRTTVTSFPSFEEADTSLKNDLKASLDNWDPSWCSALDVGLDVTGNLGQRTLNEILKLDVELDFLPRDSADST